MEIVKASEALLRHLQMPNDSDDAARQEHFSGDWVFKEIDHHGVRDWARMVSDNDDFTRYEKSFALQFVGAFAYYSDGYNVAVTTYTQDEDQSENEAVLKFISRLEARMYAKVVYRYEDDEHSTIGLKLGHRLCRHVYERMKRKGEAA